MTDLTIKLRPKRVTASWSVIDVDCPWCQGTGKMADPDDLTFEVDCICVTFYYTPRDDKQPRLRGLEDADLLKCHECGQQGFHKMSCSVPWQYMGSVGSGY